MLDTQLLVCAFDFAFEQISMYVYRGEWIYEYIYVYVLLTVAETAGRHH